MRLRLEYVETPLCELSIVTDEQGRLRALEFDHHEERMQRLLKLHYGNVSVKRGPAPKSLRRALKNYFNGEIDSLRDVEVATAGTEFQHQVWRGLRTIPPGETLSYGELAERIGRKGASRAVGAANGANPVAIVVPCHRVIGADGTLTGFGGGIERKRWLLEHERRYCLVPV